MTIASTRDWRRATHVPTGTASVGRVPVADTTIEGVQMNANGRRSPRTSSRRRTASRALVQRLLPGMVLAAVVAGCGSSTHATLEPSTTSQPPETMQITSTASTSVPATPIGAALIVAPAGFAPSSDPQVRSGPIDGARLNALFNSSDLDVQSHFVGGQEAVYDADKSSDSIHVLVFEFATEAEAQQFQAGISVDNTTSRPDPKVPGGELLDATKEQSGGGFQHIAQGTKGARAYQISYVSDTAARVPLLETLSSQQYDRL